MHTHSSCSAGFPGHPLPISTQGHVDTQIPSLTSYTNFLIVYSCLSTRLTRTRNFRHLYLEHPWTLRPSLARRALDIWATLGSVLSSPCLEHRFARGSLLAQLAAAGRGPTCSWAGWTCMAVVVVLWAVCSTALMTGSLTLAISTAATTVATAALLSVSCLAWIGNGRVHF